MKLRRGMWMAVTVVVTAAVLTVAAIIYLNAKPAAMRVTVTVEDVPPVSDPRFRSMLEVLMGGAVVEGNSVSILQTGEEIYEEMLAAIGAAEKSVTLETYEFYGETVPVAFANALSERAKAGVQVHVILDFVGSTEADSALFTQMEEAGVELVRWRKPSWYELSRFNFRTHRKLLVVDGVVGFAGGANLADSWIADEPSERYRDIHFRMEGPIVGQIHAAFSDNWTLATGELLVGEIYLPQPDLAGEVALQAVVSSPQEGNKRIRTLLLLAFASAQDSIRIATAYFYPDEMMEEALIEARRRGVEIEILAPGEQIAKPWVRHASRNRWGNLLKEGVRIYEYNPTMYHAKMYIIDDHWVSIGSANFHNRSFRINDEANINVFDPDFAARMSLIFEQDLQSATLWELEQWQERPWGERARGAMGNLIGPQL